MKTSARQEHDAMPAVGLVILAAGASTRLGTPKQLLNYHGQSLLFRSAQTAVASICRPIVIVLGAYAQQLRHEVKDLPVQVVENPQWAEGMSSSVRTGITALNTFSDNVEAVVLMLCDQPFVCAELIDSIVETYHLTNQPIVASEYGDTVGVPALFHHSLFGELVALKGAEGAKRVITKLSSQVYPVSFSRGAIDIDTPHDYEQFLGMVG